MVADYAIYSRPLASLIMSSKKVSETKKRRMSYMSSTLATTPLGLPATAPALDFGGGLALYTWLLCQLGSVGSIAAFEVCMDEKGVSPPFIGAETSQQEIFAPQIVSPLFDLSIATQWIQYCQDHHKSPCSLKKDATAELHLIDCHSLQVIPAPNGADYTALSCVWGEKATSDNPLELPIPSELNRRRLPSPMPVVIADAISVTIGLGFSYLWVDRYCIDQDSSSKHEQISQMDSIYQNAELTIVAAAGDGPQYGLPGINSRPRCAQQTYTVGHFDIISTMRHPHEAIQSSKWSSRGWTFQEATLSRRSIVFTDDQVYFECNAMNCHESLSSNLDVLHVEDKSHFKDMLQGGLFGRTDKQKYGQFDEALFEPFDMLLRYMGIVEKYTARDLTYDSDSLNAFAGIIRKFETATVAVNQIWGVPFCCGEDEKETSDSFLNGLVWAHKSNNINSRCYPRRRPEFPSWSWAGWAGEVLYEGTGSFDGTSRLQTYGIESGVESICIETDDGERVAIPDYIDQTKDFQTIRPSVLSLRAIALPTFAFSCDNSTTPPCLQIFQNSAELDLSIGPWDVPQFYHSLLNEGRRKCIYLGRWGLKQIILALEARDDCWSRVGLIIVREDTPRAFLTDWKETNPNLRRVHWGRVTSSRDTGEEAMSFQIK